MLYLHISTPLKNDGVRQIGSSSQHIGENKSHVPVSTNEIWKVRTFFSSLESDMDHMNDIRLALAH